MQKRLAFSQGVKILGQKNRVGGGEVTDPPLPVKGLVNFNKEFGPTLMFCAMLYSR